MLAEQGCREITLLGQTVNSYRFREDNRQWNLADLLVRLNDINGIERIKFVTNYPKDMTRELLETVRDLPKCSPYLHVPAQSGSDAVLKRMKRGYTVADYLEMMDRIHQYLPGASVASDFIVGFCGETEQEFQETVQLVERCRFKNSFIFSTASEPEPKGRNCWRTIFRSRRRSDATTNCSKSRTASAWKTVSASWVSRSRSWLKDPVNSPSGSRRKGRSFR